MKADILVLTPTLGNRNSLQTTVSSVKSTGGERVKHIIIAPKKEVPSLRSQFCELEVLGEPEDCKGIYMALNFVMKEYAKDYKYVTYINDDDYWLPEYEKLIDIINNNDEIDVVYGRVNYIDENGKVIREQASSSRYKSFKTLLSNNIVLFTQQATLMKSELFYRVGGFDETYKLIADTNFWLQAIELGAKFKYTNTICAAYTIQEGQLSSDGRLQQSEHQTLLKKIGKSNYFISLVESIAFRFTNINLYYKRYLKKKINR